ncbi:MAG TPA: hypothetical protein VK567_18525, partial [Bradyrhizobium sp.]|nr:hypothetical protein [Bradyrhizobium sp.]
MRQGQLATWVIEIIHPQLGQQGASIANVMRRLASLDRGQDRLQQRAGIIVRPGVMPQPGEVDRRAQFEQTRFLATGDLNCFSETGFRAQPIRLS